MAGLDFPIICPILVGRDRALADIESFVTTRPVVSANTLLVSGEAGIGKSRLVGAARDRLREKGRLVLEMSSFEQDSGLPYAAIKDLLRGVLRLDHEVVDERLRPHLARLEPLLPGSARLSDLAVLGGAPAIEREQVFEALLALVEILCETGQCVIVVEDLHWSDVNSLSSLLHIARSMRDGRLAILATLRQDDASSEVRAFLADLERERLASELQLRPLTLSETDEMLKAILRTGRSTRIEILNALYRLTEGNPFFVEELLRSLLAEAPGGDLSMLRFDHIRVPRTVQEAVARRVDALSPEARRLLELASVLGVRFDVANLTAISGRDMRSVLGSLRELSQSQLVVEGEAGLFAFRHALTREAVGSRLLNGERALLHAQIAEHIEGAPEAGAHTSDLSYHFSEAGNWEKARDYAERAGAAAMAMYAPAIALEHYNRALNASERLGQEVPSTVHRGIATALEALGDFDRSRAHLEQAIRIAEQSDDRPMLIDCLLDLGLLWASRDYTPAIAAYERAVRIAREIDKPQALARALSRLGNGHSNTGEFDLALRELDEALEIYRQVDDKRGVAETLDLIGMAGLMGGRFVASLDAYREAIELLRGMEEKRSRLSALASIPVLSGTYQSQMLAPALSLLDARPYADEALAGARELGIPSDLSYALWHRGFWLGTQGRYKEAFEAARESLSLAIEVDHKQWELAARNVIGALHADVLQYEPAETYLRHALAMSEEVGSPLWNAGCQNCLAEVLIAQRRIAEASKLFEDLRDPRPPGSIMDVWRLSAAAEVAFAEGNFERTKTLIETIEASRAIGLKLLRLNALMAVREGYAGQALDILRSAAAAAQEQGNRSMYWRLLCDCAHVHFEVGDREAAREVASAALTVIEDLAVELEDGTAYRSSAALLLPASLRQRPSRSSRAPLTAREAEIASFIARGMTNRQIADVLVVSSRTVETHVANAMAKLGFSTRAQLAAWSAEHSSEPSQA